MACQSDGFSSTENGERLCESSGFFRLVGNTAQAGDSIGGEQSLGKQAEHSSGGVHQRPESFHRVPGIAAQRLVRPLSRQYDLPALADRSAQQPYEEGAGVCDRLSHSADLFGPGGEIVRLDARRLMSHPINAAVFSDEGALADSPLYRGSRHPEREELAARYPDGVSEIGTEGSKEPWDDDVAQAVLLTEAALESGMLRLDDLATRLVDWRRFNGRGMGLLTARVLEALEAGTSPATAASAAIVATNCRPKG